MRTRAGFLAAGKRLGMAAFLFFLAKGLIWVALAVGGYAALAG